MNKLMGINYTRPPILKFNKKKETKEYTEYNVLTYKDSKKDSEKEDEIDKTFTNDIDSLIFCNESITIKVPKKTFMIKKNKKEYAYAFGMFPNPKNGKASYLDGCILGALGLKRQKTNADIICFITPDISKKDKQKLEVVFDKVIYVPYISPYKMKGEGKLKTIMMDPDIFKNCQDYDKFHPYSHVFFKLHIFNPELFPYKKVCFVDSDLVPMNYYDSLFMLNTPAGWVEYRKKWPYQKSFHWDRCDYLKHGETIPKIFTDIGTKGSSDVNAGLLVISPNKKEYDSMIKQLTSPVSKWMGPGKEHIGFYDMELDRDKSITGRKFVDSSYCYPEQNYLTKRYSGKWTYIEYAFQSWSLDPCNSFGIHMAAFNPKPWFKQPANVKVKLAKNYTPYFDNKTKDIFVSEIPKAITQDDESLMLENISISYELFNDLIIWGLVNYSKLTKFFLHNTKIYGTKISFGDDKFKKLSSKHEFKLLKDITKDDSDYKKLSISQQYITNLINDYSNFVNEVKDKYLSVCKTKTKDRYNDYNFRYDIIEYPDVKDKSLSDNKQLTKHGKISFGELKGININDITETQANYYINTRKFALDKDLRNAFLKSKYKHLVKPDNFYASKKKKKTKKLKNYSNKKKKSQKKKNNKILYCFTMKGCKWCHEFQQNLWPKLKKLKLCKFKIIDRHKNPELIQKFNIKSYPTLVLINGTKYKFFKDKRTYDKIVKFCK